MLTDPECKAAKPKAKPYKITDAKGMHLLVQPNGSKLWRLAYRFDGKQKTLALGAYPGVGIQKARQARDEAREMIASGRDPMGVKKEQERAARLAESVTFKAVAEEHHRIWKVGKTAAHVERVWARLERDAFPEIGHRPINEITAVEILDMVRKVEARRAINISKRLKQKCAEVFGYAIASGRATHDPTASINKALRPNPRVQHMAMVGHQGLPELVRAIRVYAGEPLTRLAIQFTLLTAVRTNETRFATWSEIEGSIWRIPAERMKMSREHIVPLSRQAQEVLDEVRKHSGGSPWLFPGRKGEPMSNNTMLFGLYRMGFHSRQTVHGFRRLFSTILNEREFNGDWIELQLAHAEDDGVRAAYNAAQYLKQRTEMMQWWADYLDEQAQEDQFERLFG